MLRRNVTLVVLALMGASSCGHDVTNPSDEVPAAKTAPPAPTGTSGDEVTVYVQPGGAPGDFARSLKAQGASRVGRVRGNDPIAITVPRASLARVRALPWIRIVEIDSAPLPRLTADAVPWGVDSIGAIRTHSNYANTGAGIKVAILDDGIHCTNPDLDDRIQGGYDFERSSSTYCVAGTHGTKAAGIIAAENDGSGVVGVAPGVHLYVLVVCDTVRHCGTGEIYDALGWAIDNDMQVISSSIANCGDDVSQIMYARMVALAANDAVQVWSAGNGLDQDDCEDQTVSGYAAHPASIAVAAYGTGTSNFAQGSRIDVSAPTWVLTTVGTGIGTGTLYSGVFGGTSAATPHVAGAVALMLKAGFSGFSAIRSRLKETALDLGSSGHDAIYGSGMVRADLAAVPKPVVDSITWCTGTGLTSAGYCTFTAHGHWGVETLQYRFTVRASTSPNDSTVYGWGSSSQSINVAAGTYALEVRVEARDASPYLRVGPSQYQYVPVCTGQSFLRDPESPDSEIGCGGGGGDDLRMDPNENPWGGGFVMLPGVTASRPLGKTPS